MDSTQPSLSFIFNLASSLENADKTEGIFPLMEIATELYPKSSRLYRAIGDMYVRIGNKAMAVDNYKKAIAVNPKDKEAKEKLAELEKQINE